jgi:hypothetical protein
MEMTFLKHDDNSIDCVGLLKSGSIHYVSVAMPGLTFASANVEFAVGFNIGQRNDFMMTVNRAKETGTLYPKANITLLPSPSASYGGMDSNTYNDGDYSAEEVCAHILDAFKANSQYVKSKKMYFDFRNMCVSETHYVSCLSAAMGRLQPDELPEVITWEPRQRRPIAG